MTRVVHHHAVGIDKGNAKESEEVAEKEGPSHQELEQGGGVVEIEGGAPTENDHGRGKAAHGRVIQHSQNVPLGLWFFLII